MTYQPTQKQISKWSAPGTFEMPADDWFKNPENRTRKNRNTPWGLVKRDWLSASRDAKNSYEYQMGIWQGRVDAVRGMDYSEERNEKTYNIGYYRGYTNLQSDLRGMDAETRNRLMEYAEA
jgi:hypothetical protein